MSISLGPDWRAGRKFSVTQAMVCGPWVFRPGIRYRIAPDDRRKIICLTNPEEVVLSLDRRRYLLPYIQWDDQKISEVLKLLIQHYPKSKYVRAFVRQEIGIVPPADKTPETTKEWLEFIDSIEEEKIQAGEKEESGEETVQIRVAFRENVTLRRTGYRTDYREGVIGVPIRIAREGIDQIREYLYDNANDLEIHSGDTEDGDDEEEVNSDGLELAADNIRDALRRHGLTTEH